ncbi:hypothetical protein P7H20_16105 [Paenibacillus larvae]|nr:hypothetical protein [Paenibacillus larvae]MDT2276041.1 hypothetical protein [Paenibacillus larvae]
MATKNKAYLSAILDLSDKSIVSFVGHSNNNELVFKTFDIAHMTYPDALRPSFTVTGVSNIHVKSFKKKLDDAGMTQSMSRDQDV